MEELEKLHKLATVNTFDDFKAYLEKSRKEEIPGNIVKINADNFTYQTDEGILTSIDKFMGA